MVKIQKRLVNLDIERIDRQLELNEQTIADLNEQYKEIFDNAGSGSIIDAGIFCTKRCINF